MADPSKTDQVSPEIVTAVTHAVRAISVIYNTAISYRTTHSMFERTVTERLPVIQAAFEGLDEIKIHFSEGQVRYSTMTLDPGSRVFETLAHSFNKIGVTGIALAKELSPEDISALVTILVDQADEVPKVGLQAMLADAGVRTIREEKLSIITEEEKKKKRGGKGKGGPNAGKSKEEIEAERLELMKTLRDEGRDKPFQGFVSNVLGAFRKRQTTTALAAEAINLEYEDRLTMRIAEVKQEFEVKIKRLTTIKDLVLEELESLNMSAIVLDENLNVLAVNTSGKAMLGNVDKVSRDTPLAVFIRSGGERQELEIDGVKRIAHVIMSVADDSHAGAAMVLVTLE